MRKGNERRNIKDLLTKSDHAGEELKGDYPSLYSKITYIWGPEITLRKDIGSSYVIPVGDGYVHGNCSQSPHLDKQVASRILGAGGTSTGIPWS
jgi:hypothetical protein